MNNNAYDRLKCQGMYSIKTIIYVDVAGGVPLPFSDVSLRLYLIDIYEDCQANTYGQLINLSHHGFCWHVGRPSMQCCSMQVPSIVLQKE